MSALHMIMQKWKQENVFRDHVDMDPNHVQLKIVMLGKLCGAVIGENGKTINDIKMATHTDIRVQVCLFRLRVQVDCEGTQLQMVDPALPAVPIYPIEFLMLCRAAKTVFVE
jgi:ribosomal protein S3